MRITSKGQVTIPQSVREAAGLMPGTDVDFILDGNVVRLVKSRGRAAQPTRGEELVLGLRGTAEIGMSTDDYMKQVRGSWEDEPASVWEPDVSYRR